MAFTFDLVGGGTVQVNSATNLVSIHDEQGVTKIVYKDAQEVEHTISVEGDVEANCRIVEIAEGKPLLRTP